MKAFHKADPIDPLKDIKDSFSGFEDIYNEIVSGSSVAADAIEGLNEKFGELDGGTALEDFKDTLTSMPGDISAGKEALNKLATAYIDNSDLIRNLTEDNADYVKSELSKIGVVNADEVVNSRLASSTDWLTQAQENQKQVLDNFSGNIIITSANIGSQSVASATKATQDGAGNVITSKYVTIDTTQTISGSKTFSKETTISSVTASTNKTTGALKVKGGIASEGQISADKVMIGDAVTLEYNAELQCLNFVFA